jgi:two-component system, NtrC family, response regulator GlrR
MKAGSEPADGSIRPRILLIEDAPSVARLTAIVLDGAGYDVDVAANHASAKHRLTSQRYSLVLADTDPGASTPGLSGLAELIATAHCPVVLFTAHRFADDAIEAAGFAAVIRKPYDIDDLLRIVGDVLNKAAPNGNMTTAI